MSNSIKKKNGFTLIETIVASTILCGAVLTIGAISTRSLSGVRLNRINESAFSLVDKQLSMIDYIGIEEFISTGQTEGDYEESGIIYHWTIYTEYMDIDSLYLITITVEWIERGRPYSISVDTMFNGLSTYADTGTTTGTE